MYTSSRHWRVLALLAALVLAASAATAFAATRGGGSLRPSVASLIVRLEGPDRYGTAAAISHEGWSSSDYVVVATGEDFPDALSGAPLAYAVNAPLLLTRKASLPASISAEITRLGAGHAIILGSTSAVSAAVASKIATLVGGAGNVERIGGTDRYDTARKVALRVRDLGGVGDHVVVATGLNYPDALAVAGWAAYKRYPILLTRTTELPAATQSAIASLAPAGSIVVGSASVVSEAVKNSLPSPERVAGATRYSTARAVAEYAAANGCSFAQTFVATGVNFADALGGAALAAAKHGVMVLTTQSPIEPECEAALIDHRDEIVTTYLLGSTAAIGAGVEQSADDILNAPGPKWSRARTISGNAMGSTFRQLATAQQPNGDLHVIWQYDPVSVGVTYRKLDRWGNTLIAPVKLPLANLQSGGYVESQPTIAVSDEGTVTVLWRVTGTGAGIWAIQLDKEGRLARDPTLLGEGEGIRFIEADYDPQGVLHVVTRGNYQDPCYARFDGDLSLKLGWYHLTNVTRYYLTRTPNLVARDDGSADVVWYDWRDIWSSGNHWGKYQIYHSRISSGGVVTVDNSKLTDWPGGFTEAENPGSNVGGWSWAPDVELDSDGNVNLGWINSGDDIWFSRLGPDGSESVPETRVVDTANTPSMSSIQPMVGVARRTPGEVDLVYPFWNDVTDQIRLYCAPVDPSTGAKLGVPLRVSGAEIGPAFLSLHAFASEARLVYSGPRAGVQKVYYLDSQRDAAAFDKTRPDLVVDDAHSTNVTWQREKPREGESATMSLKVTNAGWVASPQTTATFSYEGTTFAAVQVPPLAVDGSCTISAKWTVPPTMTVSPQVVRVSVDPSNTVVENSETNNSVDHLVPIWLRPTSFWITVHVMDESWDPTHTSDAVTELASATVTVRGSSTETFGGNPPGPFSRTKTAGGWVNFDLPPGSYTVTGTAAGYGAMTQRAVTVSRITTDPYVMVASGDVKYGVVVEGWFNTWGGLTGVVNYDNGTPGSPGDDTPISGAKVWLRECDRTATTNGSGVYTFPRLPAGEYHATFSADNRQRLTEQTATISAGSTTTISPTMAATTKANVDVWVTDDYGTPMSAAEVRIVKADSSFVATFTGPSGYVACTVEATPTTQYHLEVMKFDYVTETMPAFTPVAGRVYQYSVGIAPVERPGETYSDWGRWVTYSDHWQMNGNEWWGFYRNFHNRYDMFYVDKLGTRYVNWLNAYENGLGFQFECAAWAIDLDTPLGAIDVGAKIPTPYTNATRANARVDAIELVDSYTGHVLWKNQDQWYSHTKASEENVNVFDLVDSGHPDGVAVTWSTLEVWQWVTVNKAVQGKEGAAGYEHSDYQHWTNADQAVVIWTPSTNSMRIEPWVRDP